MNATVPEIDKSSQSRRLQAGGTLNPKKHIYIRRPEDEEVLRLLLAGEYVNVLTSRQMGKSSLMATTAYALQDQGARFVSIDLAGELGSPADSARYYQGLLQKIARDLRLPIDLRAWWQEHELETDNQKLLAFFKDEVAGRIEEPVVIFLDEIDSTLKLAYTDDLFTALRTMNNERGFEEAYQRVTFCLLGVATPNELIKDRRTTPYNVGRTLELRDFDAARDDPTPLASVLNPDPETGKKLLDRVLYWTGGHPYLTNRLCQDLAAAEVQHADQVNHHVDDMFRTLERVRDDVHFQQILRFVEERFTKGLESLDLYARILKGAKERDQASLAHAELKLSGLVKRNADGFLVVRNPIYARLFDRDWVASTRPKRQLARSRSWAIAASIAVGLLLGGGVLYQTLVVAPQQRVLAAREQLEALRITIVQSERSAGVKVEFPSDADQALLNKVGPLLHKLQERIVDVDLRPDDLETQPVKITDLTPLGQLADLQFLDIAGTEISNIAPIEEITRLRTLGLNNTNVTNLKSLMNNKNLELINLDQTSAQDITPLQNLDNLQWLSLNNTPVSDISPLAGLVNLQWLSLDNTQVSSISPLAGLVKLQGLSLDSTLVSDISPLTSLVNLQWLYLDNTQISNISELTGLVNLQRLSLDNTQVSNISELTDMVNLQRLSLDNTQVTDISPLSGLNNLQGLSLTSTQVSDIGPLNGLSNLQWLLLTNTLVADISPLSGLNDLQSLSLDSTQVSDISALNGLNNLQWLFLSDSQVSSEAFAAFKEDLAERGVTILNLFGPDGSRN